MNSLTYYIERDLGPFDQREYALDVTYQVNPYYAATHLQPAEGGDCEIVSILLDGKEWDGLTQAEENRLQQDCIDDAERRHDDEADARHEQARDRQMDDEWERGQ